jgi:hypothetical protein
LHFVANKLQKVMKEIRLYKLGGDKGSQEEDIKKAHAYWRESQEDRL